MHQIWSEGKGRYGFLDLYRGIIVIFMLEGHVLRELLAPNYTATQFFTIHEIFHGITAPGFLFGAGFALAIATLRRWEQVTSLSIGFLKRAWRAVTLILIGYALHVPYLSIQRSNLLATSSQWENFLSFDVLQCIGFSLLIMRLLLLITKQERLSIIVLVGLMLGIVYSTPLVWTQQVRELFGLAFAQAINGLNGSIYPLFPYAGFIIAGTCVSWLFLRSVQNGKEALFIKWLALTGLFVILLGLVIDALPLRTYVDSSFWYTSPNYFWIRLGVLFILLSALWYIEDFIANRKNSALWLPKWLISLGIESLFVYIAHLIILYGWVINTETNLQAWFSGKLNYFESIIVFIGLTLLMIPMSYFWRYLKKQHPVLMKGVFWWMGFCVAWHFVFSPH